LPFIIKNSGSMASGTENAVIGAAIILIAGGVSYYLYTKSKTTKTTTTSTTTPQITMNTTTFSYVS